MWFLTIAVKSDFLYWEHQIKFSELCYRARQIAQLMIYIARSAPKQTKYTIFVHRTRQNANICSYASENKYMKPEFQANEASFCQLKNTNNGWLL